MCVHGRALAEARAKGKPGAAGPFTATPLELAANLSHNCHMQNILRLAGARVSAVALAAMLASAVAHAGSMALQGNERWLTVASSKDKDTAIAIAGVYAAERARVVSSQSGWFAVVMGPYTEATVEAVLAAHPDIGTVPKDARLSRGENYIDTVHQEHSWEEQRVLAAYEVGKPVQFSVNDLSATVFMTGDPDNPGPTTASATRNGKLLFSFTTPTDYSQFGSDAGLLKLDPTSDSPQLVFTRFTGGAHCCTVTWIATAPPDAMGWTLLDTGALDGGGYAYEDADGDGALELMSVDNDFLYAFDSYAGSFAPIRIHQLRGNVLRDISNEPEMAHLLRRDLARMEFEAKLDPGMWRSNGFLAGWVAAKQRLGQGEDAWQTALENLETSSDFGPQICKTGKPLEDCAFEDLERVPIAKALAQFLAERDYGELPPAARALLK